MDAEATPGTLARSLDGMQLFISSGTGSFLVDPVTGDTTRVSYLAGDGTTAWLPS